MSHRCRRPAGRKAPPSRPPPAGCLEASAAPTTPLAVQEDTEAVASAWNAVTDRLLGFGAAAPRERGVRPFPRPWHYPVGAPIAELMPRPATLRATARVQAVRAIPERPAEPLNFCERTINHRDSLCEHIPLVRPSLLEVNFPRAADQDEQRGSGGLRVPSTELGMFAGSDLPRHRQRSPSCEQRRDRPCRTTSTAEPDRTLG